MKGKPHIRIIEGTSDVQCGKSVGDNSVSREEAAANAFDRNMYCSNCAMYAEKSAQRENAQ